MWNRLYLVLFVFFNENKKWKWCCLKLIVSDTHFWSNKCNHPEVIYLCDLFLPDCINVLPEYVHFFKFFFGGMTAPPVTLLAHSPMSKGAFILNMFKLRPAKKNDIKEERFLNYTTRLCSSWYTIQPYMIHA